MRPLKHLTLFLLSWIFFLSSDVFAASLPDKAFQALSRYDYFNAKAFFEKSIKKYPCIYNYGMAVIEGRKDNPFFKIDSAYAKVNQALMLFPYCEKKERQMLLRHQVDSMAIVQLKDSIETLAFNETVAHSTISGFNHFMEYYSFSRHFNAAVEMRDSLAFEIAKSDNSSEAYHEFMEKYPSSSLYFEAKGKFERALYHELTAEGTIDAYEKFTLAYPGSPFFREAHEFIYTRFTNISTSPDVYHDFILKYPSSPFVEEAWQKVYDFFIVEFNQNSIMEFKNKYPDYPYQEKLMQDYSLLRQVLLLYESEGKYGFMNQEGTLVVEPIYDYAEPFVEGMSVVSKGGKFGYVSKTGEEVIPPYYDDAEPFQNNLAIVGEKLRYGVIDRNGKMVIPLIYAEISDFSEGLAAAFNGEKYGYIDRFGNVVIPFRYDGAGNFKNGTAVCLLGDFQGIIDSGGNEVIPFQFELAEDFESGAAVVSRNELFGMVSKEFTFLLPIEYDEIGSVSCNRIPVTRKQKTGFADPSGNIVIPLIYDVVQSGSGKGYFMNNLAIVKSAGRYGIIDTSGKKLVPFVYDNIGEPSENIVAVKKGSKWGYLHLNEPYSQPALRFEQALAYRDHFAAVQIKGKWGIIDDKGKTTVASGFDELVYVSGNVYIARRGNTYGLTDVMGNELLPFAYSSAIIMEKEFVRLQNKEETIWFNTKNLEIIRKDPKQ
jgi:hypothetical protein